MKQLFILFALSPLFSLAQSYRQSGDTLFVNNKAILPGDTIHLGVGSSPYKDFVFIMEKPTNRNVTPGIYTTPSLDAASANSFLVYKELFKEKKHGVNISYPVFLVNGSNMPGNEYLIQFPGAIATKEINF